MPSPPADPLRALLAERERFTELLYASPYDLVAYIDRARVYQKLGYPDLTAGDAYRALLLTDEVGDDSGEYHVEAKAALRGRMRGPGCSSPSKPAGRAGAEKVSPDEKDDEEDHEENDEEDKEEEEDPELDAYLLQHTHQIYTLLVQSLIATSCLKSALEYHSRALLLPSTATSPYPALQLTSSLFALARTLLSSPPTTLTSITPPNLSPDKGHSRREIYPWNSHEPDRFSPSSLAFLNTEIAKVAPSLSVRVTTLPLIRSQPSSSSSSAPSKSTVSTSTTKQLGLFATTNIPPKTPFLTEPSVLTATNRLHAPLCDCCSSTLPPPKPLCPVYNLITPCPHCDDVFFCTPTCLARAQASYHPALCGKETEPLGKEELLSASSEGQSASDAPEALYLLLVARALAMAYTQDMHPLDLVEVKWLWGDFAPSPSSLASEPSHPSPPPSSSTATLPFSFPLNITLPLHFLTQMDVDIFRDLRQTDTWVLSTLLSKFRGTASARINRHTSRVDTAAVHWRWCLANHSCEPNARWQWGEGVDGNEMVFEARDGVDGKGIAEGEEIRSHYCDVDLTVRKRREWMRGTLGGDCVCERCVREMEELE